VCRKRQQNVTKLELFNNPACCASLATQKKGDAIHDAGDGSVRCTDPSKRHLDPAGA